MAHRGAASELTPQHLKTWVLTQDLDSDRKEVYRTVQEEGRKMHKAGNMATLGGGMQPG